MSIYELNHLPPTTSHISMHSLSLCISLCIVCLFSVSFSHCGGADGRAGGRRVVVLVVARSAVDDVLMEVAAFETLQYSAIPVSTAHPTHAQPYLWSDRLRLQLHSIILAKKCVSTYSGVPQDSYP
jgi:hypothetical protein